MLDGIFSPEKLLLIAAVALIFLGPKRLPQIGRSVGRWLGDLRRATGGIADELKTGLSESDAPAPVPPPATVAPPVAPPPVVAPPAAPPGPVAEAPPPPPS